MKQRYGGVYHIIVQSLIEEMIQCNDPINYDKGNCKYWQNILRIICNPNSKCAILNFCIRLASNGDDSDILTVVIVEKNENDKNNAGDC